MERSIVSGTAKVQQGNLSRKIKPSRVQFFVIFSADSGNLWKNCFKC